MATNTATQADHQVLEFDLEADRYCVGIEYIEEIVKRPDGFTRLPNSPPHVEGVVDLRGHTTQILNPKTELGLGDEADGTYVIVFDFDEEDRNIGWLVDSVVQVIGIAEEEIDSDVESDRVKGLLRQDDADGFAIWIDAHQFSK